MAEAEEVITGEDQYPIYYAMEPRPFMLSSQPSGAAGAFAKLSFAFPSARHFIYGIRISNFYELPTNLGESGVALWHACREWLDADQSVVLDLSQQSIFVNETMQAHVTGRAGVHWHPFPVPFYIGGSNNFSLIVKRLTGYPSLLVGETLTPILPSVGATLVCGVWRSDMTTSGPKRRG